MFINPFSPVFGGKPGVFFGRESILKRFDLAMMESGSDERALFITGTRGSGKTTILEQLSIRANNKKRLVIDLGPENTIEQLIHELVGYDETTSTVNPQATVNVLGFGGGISGGSVSKTKHIGRESLQSLLIEACAKSKRGILVTVDEIQKVPIDDVSALCNAFQMASRKGCDIMLAVAGLPFAYNEIIRHEGCTFLRRAAHEELGLFTWEEASEAVLGMFSGIDGLTIDEGYLDKLNESSYGHPYLMQLLGYHLILQVNDNTSGKKHNVVEEEVDNAIENALLSYEQRALKPLYEELSESERKYLNIMSFCLDEDRLASTSDVAKGFNMPINKLSKIRGSLVDNGIIAAPEHGKVMFCIPYLADYVKKGTHADNVVEVARKRRV